MTARTDAAITGSSAFIARISELEAINADLLAALKFYALPANYIESETYAPNGAFIGGPHRIAEDAGERARAAIAKATA